MLGRTALRRSSVCTKLILHHGPTIPPAKSAPARLFSGQRILRKETPYPTRNIGIIAHIDAGKTTTTERMIYYSGLTRRIGDVDEGSTVTDFLPAERARGITIQSAAISLLWPPSSPEKPQGLLSFPATPRSLITHNINLIDTPGHADFTFEVLRSLRILDGAVCILDGVAGVEAQTEKVWTQANRYGIPRIAYINKLDREGASFSGTVKAIAAKLSGYPALCQIPWYEGQKGLFVGVGDVINLRGMKWDSADGKVVRISSLERLDEEAPFLAEQIRDARVALIELLSEHDDQMVEYFLEKDEDHLAISSADIVASLRRCVLDGSGDVIPVFAGASFRNIGVQPLLDAINDLLPEPQERPDPEVQIGVDRTTLAMLQSGKFVTTQSSDSSSAFKRKKRAQGKVAVTPQMLNAVEGCALAFKVVNDPKRGVLVYVRVYSGVLHTNSLLYISNLQVTERPQRLLKMYASDATEVSSIPAGQIGVITGLKLARTGDTLISYRGMNTKSGPPQPLNQLQLKPIDIPPPVFFASVEPDSLSEERRLNETLATLLREDPSLNVSTDDESGQTLLSGMGELHLEIARDRLIGDFKAKASIGKIEVGYRETVVQSSDIVSVFNRDIAGKKGKAGCHVLIESIHDQQGMSSETEITSESISNGNCIRVVLDVDPESESDAAILKNLDESILMESLNSGAAAALSRGPKLSFPLHDVCVTVTVKPSRDFFSELESTPAAFSAASHLAVKTILKSADIRIMEPVMNVTITVDEESMGKVTQDLVSARGGQVTHLNDYGSDEGDSVDTRKFIDVSKVWVPPDPYFSATIGDQLSHSRMRTIKARVPLKEMVGYLKHLRSLTAGKGTFVMSVDKFEVMNQRREKGVTEELRGWR